MTGDDDRFGDDRSTGGDNGLEDDRSTGDDGDPRARDVDRRPGDSRNDPDAAVGGSPPDDPDDGPADVTTMGLLRGAGRRLAESPQALLAMLLAGVVVALTDQLHRGIPVFTTGYEGIQQGQISVAYTVLVSVASRGGVPFGSLLHLKGPWLAAVVVLEVLDLAAVTLAATYALARLLDVTPTPRDVARYGLVYGVVTYVVLSVRFEGGSAIVGLPLLVAYFWVTVRLVTFPALLVLGEGVVDSLRLSWGAARGHGWALFGAVLVVGLLDHLLTSVPVVGPVGSGLVGAVQAGVVAVAVDRLLLIDRG